MGPEVREIGRNAINVRLERGASQRHRFLEHRLAQTRAQGA